MSALSKTKSGSVLFKIQNLVFKDCDFLDLNRPVQGPSFRYVIERVYTIKRKYGVKPGYQEHVLCEVGFELLELWIFLNLQPKSSSQIVIDIKKLCQKDRVEPLSKSHLLNWNLLLRMDLMSKLLTKLGLKNLGIWQRTVRSRGYTRIIVFLSQKEDVPG